jgi:predicted CopG family antitoxin
MTKTVRVSERTYERIKTRQEDGETTAETLDRLVRGRPLTDFIGSLSDEEATHTRETLAVAEEATSQESAATVERTLEIETEGSN